MERHREQTDVLIVGGGTAGAIAAIQAGRAGVRTTVVEMHMLLSEHCAIVPPKVMASDRI